jgi:elongation factor G
VAFLERPTRRAEVEYTHKKSKGTWGQFAAVTLAVEPNDKGYQFVSKMAEGALPNEYVTGVEKGIESVLSSGVVAGFPVVDVRVELIDRKYHDVDSTPLAFEIAARAAFREALQKAKPVLLEPIMKVAVMAPREHAKAVIDDLRRRGGADIEVAATIDAVVPLMKMFGYDSALRAISGDHATFTMQFHHYAPAAPSPDDDPFRPAIGMRA